MLRLSFAHVVLASFVAAPVLVGCIFNDQPLQRVPAPAPGPLAEGEGEEGEGEEGEGETGEGEGEGGIPCAIELDCFGTDVNDALGGYGMCIDGACVPLFAAEWSAARFELALDQATPLDVASPRYFAESYATIRGGGETLTCLDLISGPFDPDFVVASPYLGNGVPADANTTGSASRLENSTDASVSINVPAVVGPQLVRFGIHENDDPAAVPVAIACLPVDFPAGLDVEEEGFANAPFLGGVVLSPVE